MQTLSVDLPSGLPFVELSVVVGSLGVDALGPDLNLKNLEIT